MFTIKLQLKIDLFFNKPFHLCEIYDIIYPLKFSD